MVDLPLAVQVMVLSQPSRRYNDSVAMIPELLQLGKETITHHSWGSVFPFESVSVKLLSI